MLLFTQITQLFHFMPQNDIMDASDLALEMMTDTRNKFRTDNLARKLEATYESLTSVTATVLAQLLEQLNVTVALKINREQDNI